MNSGDPKFMCMFNGKFTIRIVWQHKWTDSSCSWQLWYGDLLAKWAEINTWFGNDHYTSWTAKTSDVPTIKCLKLEQIKANSLKLNVKRVKILKCHCSMELKKSFYTCFSSYQTGITGKSSIRRRHLWDKLRVIIPLRSTVDLIQNVHEKVVNTGHKTRHCIYSIFGHDFSWARHKENYGRSTSNVAHWTGMDYIHEWPAVISGGC